jgi:hypothetical protein
MSLPMYPLGLGDRAASITRRSVELAREAVRPVWRKATGSSGRLDRGLEVQEGRTGAALFSRVSPVRMSKLW